MQLTWFSVLELQAHCDACTVVVATMVLLLFII